MAVLSQLLTLKARLIGSLTSCLIAFLCASIPLHADDGVDADRGKRFDAISFHDVRDDVINSLDADQFAVSTDSLITYFSWLRENEYHVVSIDELVAAQRGEIQLPPKSILLSFDDGYRSVYTRVFPLLKLFDYPAVIGVVTSWLSVPKDGVVPYGDTDRPRSDFLSWDEIREMQASGLVEVASHSHAMHHGMLANPQGNEQPAATARQYFVGPSEYESQREHLGRVSADIRASVADINRHTGIMPRVMIWPFGAHSHDVVGIAREAGLNVNLILEEGAGHIDRLDEIPRVLVSANPVVGDWIPGLSTWPRYVEQSRSVQVSIDAIFSPDAEDFNQNLGALIERIRRLNVTMVFLRAHTRLPNGETALYFPEPQFHLIGDVLNRVVWQLRTRAETDVFVELPLVGVDAFSEIASHDGCRGDRWQHAIRITDDLAKTIVGSVPVNGFALTFPPRTHSFAKDGKYECDWYQRANDLVDAMGGPLIKQKIIHLHERVPPWQRLLSPESVVEHKSRYSPDLTAYRFSLSADLPNTSSRLKTRSASQPIDNTLFILSSLHEPTTAANQAMIVAKKVERLRQLGARHIGFSPDPSAMTERFIESIRPSLSRADYPFRKP